MVNREFSILILTFNEEIHLPRLLDSISTLNAPTFVLDSGSSDDTLNICERYRISVEYHPFSNHPQQWHVALNRFPIQTPWVVCLDADQVLSTELLQKLTDFRAADFLDTAGIYFNRKNYFKGKWIRYGGYYPKYLLKMFRYGIGYSDLSENMDHRFQVPGATQIWKQGHLLEENLKENRISFWIAKHNQYSDLLAMEEAGGQTGIRKTFEKPRPWRSPNERKAWLKQLWWHLPLYLRPALYFTYRMTVQLGILDGKRGMVFHFLQCFWFRLLVDIKIEEIRSQQRSRYATSGRAVFILRFCILFSLIYLFQLAAIGITSPGRCYLPFAAQHLNYISAWRSACIRSVSIILQAIGFQVTTNPWGLSVRDHSGFRLVYSCLGYGVMSAFTAFVLCFPKSRRSKIKFLIIGLMSIQSLNIIRLTLLAIYYVPSHHLVNHHLVYNFIVYLLLVCAVYRWANFKPSKYAGNTQKEL